MFAEFPSQVEMRREVSAHRRCHAATRRLKQRWKVSRGGAECAERMQPSFPSACGREKFDIQRGGFFFGFGGAFTCSRTPGASPFVNSIPSRSKA